ncbi:MAG: dienelactone hydrolase family protein [Candidatus Cybelea sp.]
MEVAVGIGEGITAPAFLSIPKKATGLVLFAHGSGSSRKSPRNRFVAEVLNKGDVGTLLFDLLTPQEDAIDRQTAELRFNIGLLAARVVAASRWVRRQPSLESVPLGYFGASTGAAAALVAAAILPDEVAAIVSRGGRPDLAGQYLREVRAPTLLIVGGADQVVIGLNRQASAAMNVERNLTIVPQATHLFEEPGALEEVARLSLAWFQRHLSA